MKKLFFKRKQNRIPEFDYADSQYYFVTICTKDRKHIFGEISNNQMHYSMIGRCVFQHIKDMQKVYDNVLLNRYVIMPNHIHMIIQITHNNGIKLSRIIQQFKGSISKIIGDAIWQKSFFEHVIRDEKDYLRIYEYIEENVHKWELDVYYK